MRISDWSSDVCSSDLEAVDAGDAVADRQDLTDFDDRCVGAEIGDLVLDDLADFSVADFHCLAFHRANWAYGLSALHRLGEIVETGKDADFDQLAAQLDDEVAETDGYDGRYAGEVAARSEEHTTALQS